MPYYRHQKAGSLKAVKTPIVAPTLRGAKTTSRIAFNRLTEKHPDKLIIVAVSRIDQPGDAPDYLARLEGRLGDEPEWENM